jgi:hypothetical protein
MDTTRISLVELTSRLAKLAPDCRVSYGAVWRMATAGQIPSAEQIGRGWACDPRDIPGIVKRLKG